MRALILAALLALAATTAASAAGPAPRFKIDSCSERSHVCAAVGRHVYPTFEACEAARQHMMTQRSHALVCTGPGHPLPAGDHQR